MNAEGTYSHTNFGRNRRTVIIVILIYAALIAAILLIDAAWWLMAGLALFTLPALWDIYTNRSAGVTLTESNLHWFSGRHQAEINLSEIDHVRFDTRLDFSIRVSAVLAGKRRIRLPYEALPPHLEFEAALKNRSVRIERHHFSLL